MINKIIAVVPAFNEEKTIGEVVQGAKNYVDEIIVVDDSSDDKTGEIAQASGALVLRHFLNRGLGASLKTGISAALERGADIIITIDADGQHDPSDIPKIISPLQNPAGTVPIRGQSPSGDSPRTDVVIGSRMIQNMGTVPIRGQSPTVPVRGQSSMPFVRRLYNRLGSLITFLFFGIRVKDSQSGFRAFSRTAAEIIDIRSNRMEVSSEIIKEIKKHNLKLKEVPIQSIYTKYSLSKGQSFTKGLETFFKLLLCKSIK